MRRPYLALVVVLAAVFVVPAAAAAQTADRPAWTFGATGGGGGTWDDEGSIGKGWLVGGFVDRRLSGRVDLEFAADLLRHERDTGTGFQAEGHTTYLSAALIGRFGSPKTNVFLLGGGTVGIHSGTVAFTDLPPRETDSSNVGFIFGAGLSVRTTTNLEIAPLVRMTLMRVSDDSDPYSSIMVGVRVGFGR